MEHLQRVFKNSRNWLCLFHLLSLNLTKVLQRQHKGHVSTLYHQFYSKIACAETKREFDVNLETFFRDVASKDMSAVQHYVVDNLLPIKERFAVVLC